MNLDKLIKELEVLRAEHGGKTKVYVECEGGDQFENLSFTAYWGGGEDVPKGVLLHRS